MRVGGGRMDTTFFFLFDVLQPATVPQDVSQPVLMTALDVQRRETASGDASGAVARVYVGWWVES